jgi:hypothetical protein
LAKMCCCALVPQYKSDTTAPRTSWKPANWPVAILTSILPTLPVSPRLFQVMESATAARRD